MTRQGRTSFLVTWEQCRLALLCSISVFAVLCLSCANAQAWTPIAGLQQCADINGIAYDSQGRMLILCSGQGLLRLDSPNSASIVIPPGQGRPNKANPQSIECFTPQDVAVIDGVIYATCSTDPS